MWGQGELSYYTGILGREKYWLTSGILKFVGGLLEPAANTAAISAIQI
jgi:hypothetical protein